MNYLEKSAILGASFFITAVLSAPFTAAAIIPLAFASAFVGLAVVGLYTVLSAVANAAPSYQPAVIPAPRNPIYRAPTPPLYQHNPHIGPTFHHHETHHQPIATPSAPLLTPVPVVAPVVHLHTPLCAATPKAPAPSHTRHFEPVGGKPIKPAISPAPASTHTRRFEPAAQTHTPAPPASTHTRHFEPAAQTHTSPPPASTHTRRFEPK